MENGYGCQVKRTACFGINLITRTKKLTQTWGGYWSCAKKCLEVPKLHTCNDIFKLYL